MSTPLKFLLWSVDAAPILAESSADSNFSDGITIELFSSAKAFVESNGLSFPEVNFTLKVNHQGQEIAVHTFQMEHLNGANIWLIANPALTKSNGSFTVAFVHAIGALETGEHLLNIQLEANHQGNSTLINEGEITFISDGTNNTYQELIPLFEDVEAVRNSANTNTQNDYEDQRAQEAAAKQAARYYNVKVNNNNTSKTVYLIRKDRKNLSENILEITPNQSLKVECSRAMHYDLFYYYHNENKAVARHLATLTEALEGKELSIF